MHEVANTDLHLPCMCVSVRPSSCMQLLHRVYSLHAKHIGMLLQQTAWTATSADISPQTLQQHGKLAWRCTFTEVHLELKALYDIVHGKVQSMKQLRWKTIVTSLVAYHASCVRPREAIAVSASGNTLVPEVNFSV